MMMKNLCTQCGHRESDHGPHSGRWVDGTTIPGRYCFYVENQGWSQGMCPCTGFNTKPDNSTYLDTLIAKAGA